MKQKYYITTTAPYVNADPHIGFALEIVQADSVARFERQKGKDVIFGFGTDEHGLKIYRKALEKGISPQEYCDSSIPTWNNLKKSLNLSYTNFIRTTDKDHLQAAQFFWTRCLEAGDIYKKSYKAKYCVGCELEKTDSELEDGKCPIHPNLEIELIEEENYFFRFGKYREKLLEFYEKNPDFVVPKGKFNEIKTFVEGGLQDFSISRLKEKMPWGVPVPDDPDHVMYVWFDALTFYLSNIGWPGDDKNFKDFWPVVQVAGKDNLRQQTAIWQSMLFSAGIANSRQIFIHGFVTSNGQKISKSLGNVVDPFDLTSRYGTDATRYFLLAKFHPYEDSDFTYEKFEDAYNSDLANGLGNLIARVAKLCEKSGLKPKKIKQKVNEKIKNHLLNYRFDEALKIIWEEISQTDQFINQEEPWKLEGEKLEKILEHTVEHILSIAYNLAPFLPETAEKIEAQFTGEKIISGPALFPRTK
jgi:methionyl-tRNA synthetase